MACGVRLGRLVKLTMGASLGTVFLALPALANGGGGEKFKEGVNYIPLKPAMIVNYASSGSKVRYIRAEISLRTEDAANAGVVSHNMAVVRDTLIMYMSSLTEEELSTGEGKEHMRVTALEKINEALEAVEHPAKSEKKSDKHDEKKSGHGDEHAKADEHAKPEEHAADDHGKSAKKSGKHEEKESSHGPVSDLLFDNLVVQR